MSQPLTESRSKLSAMFKRLGIPTDDIAFYNHPSFARAERKDPQFLQQYAAWVRARKIDRAYLDRARAIVPKMAKIVSAEIIRDGQKGTCIDASMMLTKMLEEQGIWCYAVRGALTISNPSLGVPTHFWLFDQQNVPGHVWVVAPPFEVVDVVLKAQPYTHGEDKLVPDYLALESIKRITPTAEDYISTEILRDLFEEHGPLPSDVHFQVSPEIQAPARFFPSFEASVGDTSLRYSVGGITMSDGSSLQSIKSRTWNGLSAAELYETLVLPGLKE